MSAATFALSKLLVHEKAETWLRQPFLEESAEGRRPRGRRLRYAVGELMNCTRCMGTWSALGLVALRVHSLAADVQRRSASCLSRRSPSRLRRSISQS